MSRKTQDEKRASDRTPKDRATPDAYHDFVANIDECKGKLVMIEKDYRKNLNKVLSRLCAEASRLVYDDDLWAAFCADARWGSERPASSDQENAARYVIKWACDGTRDGKRNASFYWRAMRPLLRDRVPPEKMPDAIVRLGGLKKLSTASDMKISATTNASKARRFARPPPNRKQEGAKNKRPSVPSEKTSPHKPIIANLSADFNVHIATWRRLKKGSCFAIYGELENMAGPTARIRIVEFESYND